MKKEVKINDLRDLMLSGMVNFEYEKKDKSIRKAKGTLDIDLIPPKMLPQEEHTNVNAKNFKYYDIEKKGWRSLSYDCSTVKLL